MTEPVVDLLRQEWDQLASLCAPLTDAQWDTATDCPGWSVRDQIAHMIGTERTLLGDPFPEGTEDAVKADHVKNEIGGWNERWIEFYRRQSGAEVLAEFRKITALRLGALSAMDTAAFDKVGWTPKGDGPYRVFMNIRVFDCWTHEQDIRRALGTPGHMEGPVVDSVRERMIEALPFIVGKKAGAAEGNIVFFRIRGAEPCAVVISVEEGRAKVVSAPPTTATAVTELEMDFETFCCLGCGRWDGESVLAGTKGSLAIKGDDELGRKVAQHMNFMF